MDPRRALAHPSWWLALAALALNDHVLKGAGVAPSWLTGKLSDVAGMVVAPVLFAVLVGARRRAGLFAAFAAVAAGFVAIKTSVLASGAYVGAFGAIGLSARNVCDPTDLVALLALPFAWRLCEPSPSRWTSASLQRLAITLGSVACVATSQPTPMPSEGTWQTRAWIANSSSSPVEVRLRWARAGVDCNANVAWERVLGRSAFASEPLVVRLAAQQTFPLDRVAALAAVAAAQTGAPTVGLCDAVMVQADNLPTTVLRWTSATARGSVPTTWGQAQDRSTGGFVLAGSATSLTLEPVRGADGTSAAAPAEETVACVEPAHYFVTASERAWTGARTIERVSALPDGCTRLEADIDVAVLCVPAEAMPFREGDSVTIQRINAGWSIRAARGPSIEVLTSASTWTRGPAASAVSVLCEGHTACGAWVRQRGLGVGGRTLRPGESATSGGWRVFFGGAEELVTRPDACGASTGFTSMIRYDLVFVQEGV